VLTLEFANNELAWVLMRTSCSISWRLPPPFRFLQWTPTTERGHEFLQACDFICCDIGRHCGAGVDCTVSFPAITSERTLLHRVSCEYFFQAGSDLFADKGQTIQVSGGTSVALDSVACTLTAYYL
jgi:hypothetical protein